MNVRLVFTAYNRPGYFAQVLDSWAAVRGFHNWQPHAFIEPSPVQDTMAQLATAAGVSVTVNPHRRGVLSNPWHALDHAFTAGADFTVLAEDDVLASTDTLEYLSETAHRFEREHILAVCAGSFHERCPAERRQELVAHPWFCPLIWGTWRDRWTHLLRDSWDHDYSSGTPDAPQSGWDWNINLRVMADWQVISPIASRSAHIGAEGGTHTTLGDFPQTVAATYVPDRPPAPFTLPTADK